MILMNTVNLHHLKYFIDAAQEGGISQSARKNYVTQSAVSRAIASLEQDLGVDLIIHRQNQFQLTEAGEAVLEKSHEVFETVSRLKDTASDHLKTLKGPLRFGCNPAIASYLIAPALSRIELKHPGVRPELKLGNTDQVQRLIDDREVDFGIVVDDGEVGNLYRTKKLYADKLLVVQSPKLKKKDPFSHLIVSRTHKGGLSHRYFREYEKAYGKQITPKLVVSSWQVIMDLAIAGYGSALLPRFVCEDALLSKKLEIVRHKVQLISFDLCTIVSGNRALPKNAAALFECFQGTRH